MKLAEFVIPKLQRMVLAIDEANSRIEVMMNLGDTRQALADRLLAIRGALG